LSDCLDILRKAQKGIRDEDIETFLFLNLDVAIQIVNDLIDEPNSNLNAYNIGSINNTIDKETKNLAVRIKKSPNYKVYK
jgi:hypothetical protein